LADLATLATFIGKTAKYDEISAHENDAPINFRFQNVVSGRNDSHIHFGEFWSLPNRFWNFLILIALSNDPL